MMVKYLKKTTLSVDWHAAWTAVLNDAHPPYSYFLLRMRGKRAKYEELVRSRTGRQCACSQRMDAKDFWGNHSTKPWASWASLKWQGAEPKWQEHHRGSRKKSSRWLWIRGGDPWGASDVVRPENTWWPQDISLMICSGASKEVFYQRSTTKMSSVSGSMGHFFG